ncbi:MAG TPA: 50S ribosomal protein L10 [Actinomycetota bacterium]
MPKTDKVEKVKELTQRFKGSQGAMFADFRGLTVKDATELRKGLRAADADFAVVKNTLTRIAAKEAGLEGALGLLEGPTAIAFIAGDAVGGAKAVLELARRFPALVVKGALIEGRVLGGDDARALAALESREVSLAKVAGILQAPLARIAYLLQAPLSRIAYALAERGRQQSGGAPAEQAEETTETAQAAGTTEATEATEARATTETVETTGTIEATRTDEPNETIDGTGGEA